MTWAGGNRRALRLVSFGTYGATISHWSFLTSAWGSNIGDWDGPDTGETIPGWGGGKTDL